MYVFQNRTSEKRYVRQANGARPLQEILTVSTGRRGFLSERPAGPVPPAVKTIGRRVPNPFLPAIESITISGNLGTLKNGKIGTWDGVCEGL